jgi:exonuclease III
MRILSWNVHGLDLWNEVAAQSVDVALLQEAKIPRAETQLKIIPDITAAWRTSGWEKRDWQTAITAVSSTYELKPHLVAGMEAAESSRLIVSRPGSLTAADIYKDDELLLTVVSAYAAWERPVGWSSPIYADASAHRLLSDLSSLITNRSTHRVVLAGDFNLLYGYGEKGSPYWAARYNTVFDRAEAMGLRFVGPQHPNGRQAEPWPEELPKDSENVPTFHRGDPAEATRQMDFVFVSEALRDSVTARAMNEVEAWGPSDHCRILIEIDGL